VSGREFKQAQSPGTPGGYWFPFVLALLVALFFGLVFWCWPQDQHCFWLAGVVAACCGVSVGAAEIVSRYRDEPLQAAGSSFGLVYLLFNGAMSLSLFVLVTRYRKDLGFAEDLNLFWRAMLAGFGASALLRTRLAVVRGSDNKDISIGPDLVIKTLLSMLDQYVDRERASRRYQLVWQLVPVMKALGDFPTVAQKLAVSLFALQNLEPERREEIGKLIQQYQDKQDVSPEAKLEALGFLLLTLAGERLIQEVVQNAGTDAPNPSESS